jgi:hypothetical protein
VNGSNKSLELSPKMQRRSLDAVWKFNLALN